MRHVDCVARGSRGKEYMVAYRDYQRICSELRDENVLERSLDDLKQRIESYLRANHIGWVIAPDHTPFFEKLAEKIGKGVRFDTIGSPTFKVVNGENILHTQNIMDDEQHAASVRRAIRESGNAKDRQILRLVVAISSAPNLSHFRRMPIFSLNQGTKG